MNSRATSPDGAIVPSLLDYLRVLRRRKLVFLMVAVLVPATAVWASLQQTPVYEASAEVLLSSQNPIATILGVPASQVDPTRFAQTQATLARVPAVADRALAAVPDVRLTQAGLLRSSTVASAFGSDVLTFSVRSGDPSLAVRLASAYAKAFSEYQHERDVQNIEAGLEGIRKQLAELSAAGATGTDAYEDLARQERQLTALAGVETPSAQVIREAAVAQQVAPRPVRNGLFGVFLGIVLALIIAFLVDALDTRVRSANKVRDALDLHLLGSLPTPPRWLRKWNGSIMLVDPASDEAAPFRLLRARLELSAPIGRSRVIMITSAINSEGKSTTVANLGVALARTGRHVVLIDADLRKPQLHQFFALGQSPGLVDVAAREADLEATLQPIDLAMPASAGGTHTQAAAHAGGTLHILPAGELRVDPDEIGGEFGVGCIIERLRDQADVVLLDGGPLLVSDAIALSAHADALVVVVRVGALRSRMLEDLSRILEASPAAKLGFILTGAERGERYTPYQRYAVAERQPEAEFPAVATVPSAVTKGLGSVPATTRDRPAAGPSAGAHDGIER